MYNNYYENALLIPTENEDIFLKDKKESLSTVEKIGLETILHDFIEDYELEEFGEKFTNITDFTRFNEGSVDILDGYTDTYIFDNYAIGEIWVTNNGCVVLSAADLDTIKTEETEEKDYYETVRNYDIWCDCDIRLFRLN